MVPELLTRIPIAQAGRYVMDPAYAMQRKHDGKRLILSTTTGRAQAFNKRGEPCAVPALLKALPAEITPDGELVKGGSFIICDLLDCLGHDLRTLPCSQRLASLHLAIKRRALVFPASFSITTTWFTAADKERILLQAVRDRWEGVVFKRLDAPYAPGRAGQHLKLKFVKTCTVRVRSVEPTSARIEMLHGAAWVEVSGISLIGRPRFQPGDFLEVDYLKASMERGTPHLVQPVMPRRRDDVTGDDCLTDQLVFNAEEA